MSERKQYPEISFCPQDIEFIYNVSDDLERCKSECPLLNQVDLVVEGGRGNRHGVREIVRNAFPQAIYIAMDLSAAVISYITKTKSTEDCCRRIKGSLTMAEIEELIKYQDYGLEFPSPSFETIRANCFDTKLVENIAGQTNKKFPLLITGNALYALSSEGGISRYESRLTEDIFPIKQWFTNESPYAGQIHLSMALREEGYLAYEFEQVQTAALENYWQVVPIRNGLIVIKSSL
ncbi:hypothetical protein COT75_04245 [Candidatus Beckwithbacteria bacterium CG10_big_fil_rev_8_21_14_0_10_34_10]|uniref:Uncharacterized protein n=1 Tax=Candidatus Beckwithbacteria bacterium CG10_big_fil_rev_8_21_14_0_10_34_10 TaxID=1974495 RepID=A0A2H0W8E3_9BACT|nr:MAG: hypothetical protein COT75_04245 [Candidatus Beckwithbacteria bacterium CG10_big_fil_rev_8_21_14_0_10_34_10]